MRGTVTAKVVPALVLVLAVSVVSARELSFDERVAAQKAIEQVYWNHRIWPKENPGPKPSMSTVMPDATIRAKVDDYLKQSNALEKWWQRPVTADQLQAELDRMAKNTRDGATLRELFAALGNDPQLIAETLARQSLVERLIRSWYSSDTRFHGELKAKAKAALALCATTDCMRSMGGEYLEAMWKRGVESGEIAASPDAWAEKLAGLARKVGGTPASLPTGRVSSLEETSEAFVVTGILAQREGEIAVAGVSWAKVPFERWWNALRGEVGSRVSQLYSTWTLPVTPLTPCTVGTWSPTHQEIPDPGDYLSVWTGTEMIVWSSAQSPGGRYNPSTDTWTLMSTANAPSTGASSSVVWTGTEMIIWGGSVGGTRVNTGGRYNPSTNAWAATATGTGVPTPRSGHSAIWTGAEMIVWGGSDGASTVNTGGRYNPSTDAWTPTATLSAPTPRSSHSSVWTGLQMVVWGGLNGSPFANGGRYNPSTNSWTGMSTIDAPTARQLPTCVWTGTEMIIWGGQDGDYVNTGARYNPSINSWSATSTGTNVPPGRGYHSAVWTGTEMIIWGGESHINRENSGARYNPSTDSWTPTSTGSNVPAARAWHNAVWTGSEMIIWGGSDGGSNDGGRYVPSTDSWTPTSTGTSVPIARARHAAVWTGTEMIVWGGGGASFNQLFDTGGRYLPATDSWTPTSTGTNLPTPRQDQTAVWTGTEMIVWGGSAFASMNTGGRYNPANDTWTPTSTGTNVPSPRALHTAVWTGTQMIVWGGISGGVQENTGGRYTPSSDNWATTSTGPGVPGARAFHAAVWTGADMIVWGGSNGVNLNTGGRYTPASDSWSPTSTGANVPGARDEPTAVWTGTEMIVWGGDNGGSINTGGRYNPSTDNWTPTSTGSNVPAARHWHTAVWTGAEMIVWGGYSPTSTGGQYNPASDSWAPTSMGANVPTARYWHSAVHTGTEMIVWGGSLSSTGGRYCTGGCASPAVWYQDADGDGYGVASVTVQACVQPSAYAPIAGDCNDTNPAIRPGAPEVNDGLENQCPGDPGYGVIDEISGASGFFAPGDKTLFSWPAQSGATSYEIARSPFRDFHAGCVHTTTVSASWTDPASPAPGAAFYYLVRAAAPHIGSWGQRRPAVERTVCAGCVGTGDWCDDGNVCTTGDVCTVTVCGGAPLSCDDGNPCTNDSCNPGSGCVHTNNSASCDDGNACTTGDVCSGGSCAGTIPPGANHVVISQVQASGDGSNPLFDEFVEIYNPTSAAISLSGYRLHVVTATFPSFQTSSVSLGAGSIASHGWLLVASSDYNGSVPRDITLPFGMSSTTESLMLVDNSFSVTSCNPSGLVDKLGYGSSPSCSEGAPAPALTANNSLLRKPGGACGNGIDTNANSADFVIQVPSAPRNSSSTAQP